MHRAKKNLQAPAAKANPPVAPKNFWESLDKLHAEASQRHIASRPANSFTCDEYALKYDLGKTAVLRRLKKLIKAGKIQRHGIASNTYYTLT